MLPTNETQWIKIKVGKDEFEIRAWLTKDEKNYLIRKEQTSLNDDLLFDVLIKPCIKNAENYNFTENQKQYIMVKIREISLGEDIIINFSCSKCNNFQEIDISLNNIVEYKPESYKDVKIGKYTFLFKKNNSPKVKERLDSYKSNVEKDFALICLSIDKIFIDKEVHDSFTFDELVEFIENLNTKTFNKLFSEFYDMLDDISFHYTVMCQVCNHKNEGDLTTIPNFLWE